MKLHQSMKIARLYDHAIQFSYCSAQHLLRYHEPRFYNAGVYGWNNDMYTGFPGDVIIVTGYRNLRGIVPDYELVKEYDKKAMQIENDWSIDYETKCKLVDDLLNELIAKTIA